MQRKIKAPFSLLCDFAVLPQSEKKISIELTFYSTQINHALKCAEISAVPLRCVREKSQLEDWSKSKDLVNACNSAKLWLSVWNDCGRPRDGLVNDLRLLTKRKFNKE